MSHLPIPVFDDIIIAGLTLRDARVMSTDGFRQSVGLVSDKWEEDFGVDPISDPGASGFDAETDPGAFEICILSPDVVGGLVFYDVSQTGFDPILGRLTISGTLIVTIPGQISSQSQVESDIPGTVLVASDQNGAVKTVLLEVP